MGDSRPFRFGVQLFEPNSKAEFVRKAQQAEHLGYSSLLLTDHFYNELAPVPALMAAADATTSLRLGNLVFNNDFRHPAVFAKEIATLDLLSDGRFELGIGCGSLPSDYDSSGISLDRFALRAERLEEALRLIKLLLGSEPVTFCGKHYQTESLEGVPKPVQRPYPPILVGGGSERMLSIAAREADIASPIPRTLPGGRGFDAKDSTGGALTTKIEFLQREAGKRFQAMEINAVIFHVEVTSNRQGAAEELAHAWRLAGPIPGASATELLVSPYVLIGTTDQMIEQLERQRERYRLSYVVVSEHSAKQFAPVVAGLTGR